MYTEVKIESRKRRSADRAESFVVVVKETTVKKQEILTKDGKWEEIEGYLLVQENHKIDLKD